MENTNGYKREDVQKIRTGRFEKSNFIKSKGGDGQNKIFENLETRILDNSDSKEVSGRRKRWRKPQRRRRKRRMRMR